jgi:hypothetical protein
MVAAKPYILRPVKVALEIWFFRRFYWLLGDLRLDFPSGAESPGRGGFSDADLLLLILSWTSPGTPMRLCVATS